MTDTAYLAAAVIVSALVTWALRALPFLFLHRLRHSAVLQEVGAALPVGVMTVLVLHTVHEVPPLDPARSIPVLVGLVATAGLHLWRGNALLSIGVGTGLHVVLASTLPGVLG